MLSPTRSLFFVLVLVPAIGFGAQPSLRELELKNVEEGVLREKPIGGDDLILVGVVAHRDNITGPVAINARLLLPANDASFYGKQFCVIANSHDARLKFQGQSAPMDFTPASGQEVRIVGPVKKPDVRRFLDSMRPTQLSLRAAVGPCDISFGNGAIPTVVALDPAISGSAPAKMLRVLLNVQTRGDVTFQYIGPKGKRSEEMACGPRPSNDKEKDEKDGGGAWSVACYLPMPDADQVTVEIKRYRSYREPLIDSIRLIVSQH